MGSNFMAWMILWALVTTAVLVLAFWRSMLGLHDFGGIHIGEGEKKDAAAEEQLNRKIARIEKWGKSLTVASAVLILGIGCFWVLHSLG